MPLEPVRDRGLLAREGDYLRLRAFDQGGAYWDKEAQDLVLSGGLREFLPAVETARDEQGDYGRFHRERGGRELLSRSKPLGQRRVPSEQLRRLRAAVAEFRGFATAKDTQPHKRALIERFQLPDPGQEPELYRFIGPWWNRRLQVLWGCERTANSSLPATDAVAKLLPDKWNWLRRLSAWLLLLALVAGLAWALGRLLSDSSRETAPQPRSTAQRPDQQTPTNRAAVPLPEGSNATTRVVTPIEPSSAARGAPGSTAGAADTRGPGGASGPTGKTTLPSLPALGPGGTAALATNRPTATSEPTKPKARLPSGAQRLIDRVVKPARREPPSLTNLPSASAAAPLADTNWFALRRVKDRPGGDFPPPPVLPDALPEGKSATVEVRIDVAADGAITQVAVEQPSGVAGFDQHVLDHVRQRFRFAPPGASRSFIYVWEQRAP